MKKLFLTLLVLSSSLVAFSQGTWTPRDTLPYDSAMFQGIPGFSIGDYGYAGLGSWNNEDYFWQFDPSTDKWTKKAPFPGSARVAPACFVICNMAYLVTGSVTSGGLCVTECWGYNTTTNKWEQKANFPGPTRTYAVGFAINGFGYVGTGANELRDFRKDFYRYNPDSNTWTRVADFGGIARDGDCGFAVNGKGYVCFGQDSTLKTYNDIWEYDPGSNSWTQKPDYPAEGILSPSGFAICNNIYVGSGDSTSNILSNDHRFWNYNTLTDTWSQETIVPGITTIQGVSFAIGDTGYYGFGWDSVGRIQNKFKKFFAGDSCRVIDTCMSEGYQMLSTNSDIEIYPNPFNTICYIKIPDIFHETPVVFALYNTTGLQQKIDIRGNGLYYTINRNGMNDGIYILSVKYNDHNYYKKLVIIN